jgi:hypothetical protein
MNELIPINVKVSDDLLADIDDFVAHRGFESAIEDVALGEIGCCGDARTKGHAGGDHSAVVYFDLDKQAYHLFEVRF